MKRKCKVFISCLVMVSMCLLLLPAGVYADQSTADSNANAKTKETLNWLADLALASNNKVAIGQYITRNLNNTDGRTPAQAMQFYYNDLYTMTGKYPGLAGFDLSQRAHGQADGSNMPSDSNFRSFAQAHYNNGGLLRFMWVAGNPWTGETSWSVIPTGHTMAEMITPGNPAYDTYMSWLAEIGDIFQWYEDNNITIMWGPFHENNGTWFWWGPRANCSPTEFKNVWIHMYNYLTNTRGLHNILWMYCPDNGRSVTESASRYPGNAYVDIIAPDLYYTSPTGTANADHYNEFTKSTYRKVFGWGEIGSKVGATTIDNRKYINEIRSTFPKVSFYMHWMDVEGDDHSIRSNNYADEVMDDLWIKTREEVGKFDFFSEYFEDGDSNGWVTSGGTWGVVTDGTKVYQQSNSSAQTAVAYLSEGASWNDYTYQSDIKMTSIGTGGSGAGLAFRLADSNNFYFFQLRQPDNEVRLYKNVNGTYTQIGSSAACSLNLNSWYTAKVAVSGSSIKCYVNNNLLIDEVDSTFSSGKTGFRMFNTAAEFDRAAVASFNEYYEDGNPNGWVTSGGTWGVVTDGTKVYQQSNSSAQTAVAYYNEGASWNDYIYESDIKMTSIDSGGSGAGLAFRLADSSNFHFFQLRQPDNQVWLYKNVNGTYTQIGSAAACTLNLNTWYNAKVVVSGDSIKCYVNNNLLIDAVDGTFNSGKVGFRMYNTAAEFDNVLVRE